MDQLVNQKQAAHALGISERTLERHRVGGTGPRWARLGRLVRYRLADLEEWVEKNLRLSTSEPATLPDMPKAKPAKATPGSPTCDPASS